MSISLSKIKEDFQDFWICIWQNEHEEDLGNASWVLEVREALRSARHEQQETPIVAIGEMVSKCLRKIKKKKIRHRAWIRSLTTGSLAIAITRIINIKLSNIVSIVPVRMPEGRTVLIPRKKNPASAREFRPITGLNTMCKLISLHDQQQITKSSVCI